MKNEYYENIYQKRLNRYGLDFQARIQGQREKDFENYLYKTIYRVDFEYEGKRHPGSLERYKQDYSETQGYLLTRNNLRIPNGTILQIKSQNESTSFWMIWWLEQIESSGYNRYVVLKMTHYLSWNHDGLELSQWGYFRGPGTSTILDTIKTSSNRPVYSENNNLHMFITPQNNTLTRDQYFEVEQGGLLQGYVVKEFDINSTPGVGYITVDPVPLRDKQLVPKPTEKDEKEDFYWLNGGVN